MRITVLIVSVILLFFSCKKEETPINNTLISGKNYTKGLKVDGNEFDGLIIENCTFTKKPLRIGNAKNIIVRNCIFEDIKDNGLELGFIGEVSNITIDGCTFESIGYNGIDSHREAYNCTISNCLFTDIALSEIGVAMGQPHHGIYWKGKGVSIINNKFINGKQPSGNAISIRSSGKVSGNKIYDAPKNGIMYYADHPGSDTLLIENNFIVNSKFYSVIMASSGNLDYHNKNVIVRFNTCYQTDNESFYVGDDFQNTTNVKVYGNIFVNTTGSYFKTFYTLNNIYSNIESTKDIGFVDLSGGDLHIKKSSVANGFCSGLSKFPINDIDGDKRISTNLDAGADEID